MDFCLQDKSTNQHKSKLKMEDCQMIPRFGKDIGIGKTLQPKSRKHCVGTGFDPNLESHDLLKIAYEEDFENNIRPNIIVRGGKKGAQWYLKYFEGSIKAIDRQIEKTMRFRSCPHHVMYIIIWND